MGATPATPTVATYIKWHQLPTDGDTGHPRVADTGYPVWFVWNYKIINCKVLWGDMIKNYSRKEYNIWSKTENCVQLYIVWFFFVVMVIFSLNSEMNIKGYEAWTNSTEAIQLFSLMKIRKKSHHSFVIGWSMLADKKRKFVWVIYITAMATDYLLASTVPEK